MATNVERAYQPCSQIAWGAVFGGTFVYLAIMATFGALGAAIFANASGALGPAIWMTILGILALYFAGRTAGHLAAVPDRDTGLYHGLVTFGMSVLATVLVLALALGSTTGNTGQAANQMSRWNFAHILGAGGWGLFLSLFLGMLAAIAGGMHNVPASRTSAAERPEIRKIA
jgi:hypothetical protein